MFTREDIQVAFPEFDIESDLGEGSFKKAYAVGAPNRMALKVIIEPVEDNHEPTEGDEENNSIPSRLSREIQAMTIVNHPNIVQIVGEPQVRRIGDNKHYWYTETLYEGLTLKAYLETNGPSPELARRLLERLLPALAELNAHNIVHRDIKPGNIMIADANEPVLLDLGIALMTNLSPLTDSAQFSPATTMYAAPEQFELKRNALVDHRTDMYQLAVVAFETAAGRHPFYRKQISPPEFLNAMYNFAERQASAELAASGLDDRSARVIARCLNPEMSRRYRRIMTAINELEL